MSKTSIQLIKEPTTRKDVVSFFYQPKVTLKEAPYVFVWDLDKTYLDTHFESLGGLIRVAFEKAFKKRNVPGAAELIRVLSDHNKNLPLYFVSASPPQMEERIREKWDIDGIAPYGFFSKDNLKNLRPSKWARLTNHIGFKLQALMELRLLIDDNCQMICWGDDSESDATIYSLFSDLCAHRLTDREARFILDGLKVSVEQRNLILELRDARGGFDPLSRVYINLAVDTDPEYYRRYGRRLMAVENTFEVALDLFQRGFVSERGVVKVGQDLLNNYGLKLHHLEEAYALMCKRRRVSVQADQKLRLLFVQLGLFSEHFDPVGQDLPLMELDSWPLEQDFKGVASSWVLERVNYLSDY